MLQPAKNNEKIGAVNRGTPCESGLCGYCRVDCQGRCETWLSSLYGRKTLFPKDYGNATLGSDNTCHVGVSYNALRIPGAVYGAAGLDKERCRKGDAAYADADITARFGRSETVVNRFPLLVGALSLNPVVDRFWPSFAIGAALSGIPLVIGENVGGSDGTTEYDAKGRVTRLPQLDKRIETYMRYHDGHGKLIVQMNANDTDNGVADYVAERYGDKVFIEIKWGQGAKAIGGEGIIRDIDRARFMQSRGYCIRPNPSDPQVAADFASGKLTQFVRYTALTYPEIDRPEEVIGALEGLMSRLRERGAKGFTLKTGAYGMADLALSIKAASALSMDLLTIDGAGGGTGMSPPDMMDAWGVPSLLLHAKAHEYATLLAAQGTRVVDMAIGGGFARPSHLFKAMALGAPFVKTVCLSRAIMIPAFLGCNIEGALHPERRAEVNGAWDSLPKSVAELGTTPEAIFAGYHSLEQRLGKAEMPNIPYGAIATWTLCDRLGAGLQHLMGGARRFNLDLISRDDIAAANRDTARETGIPFITDAGDELAKKILKG